MNIVLFGGAFDPPHLGHLFVITQAFELIPEMDELWLLPAFDHSFGKDMAPPQNRLEMCRLFIEELNLRKVKLCTTEIDNEGKGSTLETLHQLQNLHPEHSFSFLMGSDQITHFHKWINYQDLLNEMHFYVYPRAGYPYLPTYPQMTFLEADTQVITNISSTLVRKRLAHDLGTSHLLSGRIFEYISNRSLYGNKVFPRIG